MELMIAALIMGISTLAMYFMFNQGQELNLEQEHRRIVFEKAQAQLAVFKAMADNGVIYTGTNNGSEDIVRAGMPRDPLEIPLRARFTVQVNAIEQLVFRIKIQYQWEERSGRDYQITIVDCYPY
jgi:hypothetical protein